MAGLGADGAGYMTCCSGASGRPSRVFHLLEAAPRTCATGMLLDQGKRSRLANALDATFRYPERIMFRPRPTPPRVLIVDDESSVTVYLDRLLSANGCTTVAVNRGAEAQAVLERGDRFDVAVLDVMMPDMTGD